MRSKRKNKGDEGNCSSKKAKVVKTDVKENVSPTMMNTLFARFPHISEAIFSIVDNKSLSNSRKVNREWRSNIDNLKNRWIRKIQWRTKKCDKFRNEWDLALKGTPVEILKKLCSAIDKFNGFRGTNIIQLSPLHIVARIGPSELFTYVLAKMEIKNPENDHKWTPFHEAVRYGHLDIVKCSFDNVQDKNPKDKDGWTPIHMAAYYGQFEILKYLRENMSEKNPIIAYGRTLLHCAAWTGKLEICKYLIEDKARINLHPRDHGGCTPLGYAAQYGHLDVCKLINVSDKNPMFHERWSPLGWGSPLDRAVYYGQLEVFKYLAADMRGPHMPHLNPSKEDGWSLLHYAAKEGHLEVFKFIVNTLVDKNPKSSAMEGKTPLHIACEYGKVEICKYIMKKMEEKVSPTNESGIFIRNKKLDISPKMDNGRTPLHLAAINDHSNVCRCLMEHMEDEKDMNPKDNEGKTPLILAAEKENWYAVNAIGEILSNLY